MDTDWPLIAVRFALYATLSGLFGLSAFSLYGLKARERADALALRPWLVGSGLLGLLFSGIGLALLAAAMAGAPLWPVDQEAVGMLLSGSATGTAWEARVAALVVASIAALVAAGRAALLGLVAFAAGVKRTTPLARVTEPAAGCVTAVTLKVPPSMSLSLANTLITVSVLSSATVAVSATAIGASFTAVMLTVTVAELVSAPSLMV